jgi:hypothetical protein
MLKSRVSLRLLASALVVLFALTGTPSTTAAGMPGARHLPPYTTQEPKLGVVERVTTAFLDRYLKQGSLDRIAQAAYAPGIATLVKAP